MLSPCFSSESNIHQKEKVKKIKMRVAQCGNKTPPLSPLVLSECAAGYIKIPLDHVSCIIFLTFSIASPDRYHVYISLTSQTCWLSESKLPASTKYVLSKASSPIFLSRLPEAGSAAAHNLALAHKLCAELGAVQSQVNVKVYSVEGTLRRIHSLEILFEVLARQIRCKGDNFLDTYWKKES